MSSWWYVVDICKSRQELNPLLPQIAGVIENFEEASFSEIKEQVEKDAEKPVKDMEVKKALDNGIQLGVFQMDREFKICREFTTKEIKKAKPCDAGKTCELFGGVRCMPLADKNLMKFVRDQREERKNKMHKRRRKIGSVLKNKYMLGNPHLYKYLCNRCKKSVERELEAKESSSTLSEEENGNNSAHSAASLNSSNTCNSGLGIRFSGELEAPPEKSKLLVEKNPMETDPPYYDIFT